MKPTVKLWLMLLDPTGRICSLLLAVILMYLPTIGSEMSTVRSPHGQLDAINLQDIRNDESLPSATTKSAKYVDAMPLIGPDLVNHGDGSSEDFSQEQNIMRSPPLPGKAQRLSLLGNDVQAKHVDSESEEDGSRWQAPGNARRPGGRRKSKMRKKLKRLRLMANPREKNPRISRLRLLKKVRMGHRLKSSRHPGGKLQRRKYRPRILRLRTRPDINSGEKVAVGASSEDLDEDVSDERIPSFGQSRTRKLYLKFRGSTEATEFQDVPAEDLATRIPQQVPVAQVPNMAGSRLTSPMIQPDRKAYGPHNQPFDRQQAHGGQENQPPPAIVANFPPQPPLEHFGHPSLQSAPVLTRAEANALQPAGGLVYDGQHSPQEYPYNPDPNPYLQHAQDMYPVDTPGGGFYQGAGGFPPPPGPLIQQDPEYQPLMGALKNVVVSVAGILKQQLTKYVNKSENTNVDNMAKLNETLHKLVASVQLPDNEVAPATQPAPPPTISTASTESATAKEQGSNPAESVGSVPAEAGSSSTESFLNQIDINGALRKKRSLKDLNAPQRRTLYNQDRLDELKDMMDAKQTPLMKRRSTSLAIQLAQKKNKNRSNATQLLLIKTRAGQRTKSSGTTETTSRRYSSVLYTGSRSNLTSSTSKSATYYITSTTSPRKTAFWRSTVDASGRRAGVLTLSTTLPSTRKPFSLLASRVEYKSTGIWIRATPAPTTEKSYRQKWREKFEELRKEKAKALEDQQALFKQKMEEMRREKELAIEKQQALFRLRIEQMRRLRTSSSTYHSWRTTPALRTTASTATTTTASVWPTTAASVWPTTPASFWPTTIVDFPTKFKVKTQNPRTHRYEAAGMKPRDQGNSRTSHVFRLDLHEGPGEPISEILTYSTKSPEQSFRLDRTDETSLTTARTEPSTTPTFSFYTTEPLVYGNFRLDSKSQHTLVPTAPSHQIYELIKNDMIKEPSEMVFKTNSEAAVIEMNKSGLLDDPKPIDATAIIEIPNNEQLEEESMTTEVSTTQTPSPPTSPPQSQPEEQPVTQPAHTIIFVQPQQIVTQPTPSPTEPPKRTPFPAEIMVDSVGALLEKYKQELRDMVREEKVVGQVYPQIPFQTRQPVPQMTDLHHFQELIRMHLSQLSAQPSSTSVQDVLSGTSQLQEMLRRLQEDPQSQPIPKNHLLGEVSQTVKLLKEYVLKERQNRLIAAARMNSGHFDAALHTRLPEHFGEPEQVHQAPSVPHMNLRSHTHLPHEQPQQQEQVPSLAPPPPPPPLPHAAQTQYQRETVPQMPPSHSPPSKLQPPLPNPQDEQPMCPQPQAADYKMTHSNWNNYAGLYTNIPRLMTATGPSTNEADQKSFETTKTKVNSETREYSKPMEQFPEGKLHRTFQDDGCNTQQPHWYPSTAADDSTEEANESFQRATRLRTKGYSTRYSIRGKAIRYNKMKTHTGSQRGFRRYQGKPIRYTKKPQRLPGLLLNKLRMNNRPKGWRKRAPADLFGRKNSGRSKRSIIKHVELEERAAQPPRLIIQFNTNNFSSFGGKSAEKTIFNIKTVTAKSNADLRKANAVHRAPGVPEVDTTTKSTTTQKKPTTSQTTKGKSTVTTPSTSKPATQPTSITTTSTKKPTTAVTKTTTSTEKSGSGEKIIEKPLKITIQLQGDIFESQKKESSGEHIGVDEKTSRLYFRPPLSSENKADHMHVVLPSPKITTAKTSKPQSQNAASDQGKSQENSKHSRQQFQFAPPVYATSDKSANTAAIGRPISFRHGYAGDMLESTLPKKVAGSSKSSGKPVTTTRKIEYIQKSEAARILKQELEKALQIHFKKPVNRFRIMTPAGQETSPASPTTTKATTSVTTTTSATTTTKAKTTTSTVTTTATSSAPSSASKSQPTTTTKTPVVNTTTQKDAQESTTESLAEEYGSNPWFKQQQQEDADLKILEKLVKDESKEGSTQVLHASEPLRQTTEEEMVATAEIQHPDADPIPDADHFGDDRSSSEAGSAKVRLVAVRNKPTPAVKTTPKTSKIIEWIRTENAKGSVWVNLGGDLHLSATVPGSSKEQKDGSAQGKPATGNVHVTRSSNNFYPAFEIAIEAPPEPDKSDSDPWVSSG